MPTKQWVSRRTRDLLEIILNVWGFHRVVNTLADLCDSKYINTRGDENWDSRAYLLRRTFLTLRVTDDD